MKVLKFGGTSVGTVNNIIKVKKIIESNDDQVVVVVSALGGITDKLIEVSHLAADGKIAYQEGLSEIRSRHIEMVFSIISGYKERELLVGRVNELIDELSDIYQDVFKSRKLTPEVSASIVSFGERLSSVIISTFIQGSLWLDSRKFILTEKKLNKNILDATLTEKSIQENFRHCPKISLVPGFISSDKNTGEITNLGRGGSDYTAAIIASALHADRLEIWTDVDGFMTADPRMISSAFPIGELSYEEAIELCNYGAKVIYPPTIHPVCEKNIPILIKNTLRPEAPGTIITRKVKPDTKAIKGISSFKDTCMISIPVSNTMNIPDIQKRILKILTEKGLCLSMLSKFSCTDSICMGVHNEDVDFVCETLNQFFAEDKTIGHIHPLQVERDLATVTVVGENMRLRSKATKKLFVSLEKQGINVIASTKGESTTNLSFVTEYRSLSKALNVTHDSFFLKRDALYSHRIKRVC